MTAQGVKNTGIRENNIESILRLLYTKQLSATHIAKALKLSKTAVFKILSEMEGMNLVENLADSDNENEKYKRTLYAIKQEAGILGVVEFGSTYIKIVFSYLNGEIFDETIIEDREFLNLDDLNEICTIILNKKKQFETDTRSIISIIVSAPGQINKFTDEIENSVKFNLIKDVSVRAFFEEKLQLNVILKNDINLAIIGEQHYGKIERITENGILIYVDSGMGGAILNENKIIEGDYGYAAEFGLISTYDQFGNNLVYDLICSINSIKKQITYQQFMGKSTMIGEKFRYRNVVKAFYEKDELVLEVVKYTAHKLGELISNLSYIFNYRQFFVGGRIKALGQQYLDWVLEGLDPKIKDISIKFTTLGDENIIYGAIHVGVTNAFGVVAKK